MRANWGGFKKLVSFVTGGPGGEMVKDKTLVGMLAATIGVIIHFRTNGEVWFAAHAPRRGETVTNLLATA